jgi:predicted dehydrogenase
VNNYGLRPTPAEGGGVNPLVGLIYCLNRSWWIVGGLAQTIQASDYSPLGGSKPIGTDEDAGTQREWLAFLESVRTGKQPIASGHVGKEAIRIPLMAEKSIRERRIVNYADLPA